MRELQEQASKGGQGATSAAQGSGVTDDVDWEEDFCESPSPPTSEGGGDLTTQGKSSPSPCLVNCVCILLQDLVQSSEFASFEKTLGLPKKTLNPNFQPRKKLGNRIFSGSKLSFVSFVKSHVSFENTRALTSETLRRGGKHWGTLKKKKSNCCTDS